MSIGPASAVGAAATRSASPRGRPNPTGDRFTEYAQAGHQSQPRPTRSERRVFAGSAIRCRSRCAMTEWSGSPGRAAPRRLWLRPVPVSRAVGWLGLGMAEAGSLLPVFPAVSRLAIAVSYPVQRQRWWVQICLVMLCLVMRRSAGPCRTSWLTPGRWREGWLDQASRLCSSWRQARYCATRCKPLVFPGFSQVPAPGISVMLAQRIVWGGDHPPDDRQLP
jgi:hypothetical protein